MGNFVISVEIDSNKIQCSQHNSKIYGVERNIEFINGDYSTFSFFKNSVDVVLLAPPWGKDSCFLKRKEDLTTPIRNILIFKKIFP
jgi:predicted RNA methylase